MSNAVPDLTQITESTGRHYLDREGNSYVSVTTALNVIEKGGLVKWAASLERNQVMDSAVDAYTRCHVTNTFPEPGQFRRQLNGTLAEFAYQTAKDDAATLGTEVHNAVEQFLKTGSYPATSPAATIAVREFNEWWSTQRLKVLLCEERLVSKVHGYAGTVDALFLSESGDDVFICDLKTSKSIGWTYYLQLAAYAFALVECGYEKPTKGRIIQVPKTQTHKLKIHNVDDLDRHFDSFLTALKLYKAQQEDDPWKQYRRA